MLLQRERQKRLGLLKRREKEKWIADTLLTMSLRMLSLTCLVMFSLKTLCHRQEVISIHMCVIYCLLSSVC